MLRATFRDAELEAGMTRNGFAVIKGLMGKHEVKHMLDLYLRHHSNRNEAKGMWNSLYDTQSGAGMDISQELLNILKPKFETLFESYHTPVATFMSKNANENSITPLHRDYSILDESRFQYRNIWIPLVDTSVQNGALYVLRSSNQVFTYPFPFMQKWPYTDMIDYLFPLTETVQANAGDCVVYSDKTLHGSFINRSNDSRPVVHLGALHPDIELLFYYYDKNTNEVRAYKVPNDFYFKNEFDEPVGKYPLYSTFKYVPPPLQAPDVIRELKTLWATESTAI